MAAVLPMAPSPVLAAGDAAGYSDADGCFVKAKEAHPLSGTEIQYVVVEVASADSGTARFWLACYADLLWHFALFGTLFVPPWPLMPESLAAPAAAPGPAGEAAASGLSHLCSHDAAESPLEAPKASVQQSLWGSSPKQKAESNLISGPNMGLNFWMTTAIVLMIWGPHALIYLPGEIGQMRRLSLCAGSRDQGVLPLRHLHHLKWKRQFLLEVFLWWLNTLVGILVQIRSYS